MSAASAPASPSVSRYAWLLVALLWPVALLNYLDRQMLASMKFSVMHQLPDIGTEANWGLMLGRFKFVYAFMSPFGGYIADRFSRRWTICGSLFVWSAITFATGHVTSFEGLMWTRSLMGISEACYIPAALALIADFHRGSTRSRATGWHQMAIYCGVIVGGFSGYVADAPNFGWRWAFSACGVFGMIYALPLLFLLRDAPRDGAAKEAGGSVGTWVVETFKSFGRSAAELLANPSFLLLTAYFTLPALAGWIVRDWMPALLKQQFNLGQGAAGVSASLYWQVGAVIGSLLGGWLADRWMLRGPRGRIYVSALGMAMIVPALAAFGFSSSLPIAIVCLSLFGLGWGFFDGNNMPILCQIARPDLRATGYGLMNMVSIGCGGFADWGFGAMRDRQVPLPVIFGAFASVALCSGLLVLLVRPREIPEAA